MKISKAQFDKAIKEGFNKEGKVVFVCNDDSENAFFEFDKMADEDLDEFIKAAAEKQITIENLESKIYFVLATAQEFEEFNESCQLSTDGGNARPIRTCRRPKPYQWKAHYSDFAGCKVV